MHAAQMPVVLLVIMLIRLTQAANSYCCITTCQDTKSNTLCKYSETTWGAACTVAFKETSSLSAAEKITIVDEHNKYRRRVAKGEETRGSPTGPQPPASDMRQLVWDDELARMAQTHAQQCVFEHDTCRDVQRFRVGQNIYISMATVETTSSDWPSAVRSWYDEVVDMTNAYVASLPSNPPKVIGHYTQLVWAETYTVGCGVASYRSTATNPGFPFKRLYVCNYGPTGNWLNRKVYTQGVAGSACPTGTVNNDGLCAVRS